MTVWKNKLSHILVLASVLVMIGVTFLLHSLFYPLKHKKDIIFYAAECNLPPALVCSIINVESGFDERAISPKGAMGLMQIMPSTAQPISAYLGEPFTEQMLFDAKVNIRYGCHYLSMLLSSFSLDEAICAYNAGPTRVREWLKDERYSSDGKSLSLIPYVETREYLKKVKKNLLIYQNKVD